MHLPQELIDMIIDYLYDSRTNLKTCCLVCRSWVAPSRFHLFATTSLLWNGLHRWSQHFQPSTSPSHLVRTLYLGQTCTPPYLDPFLDHLRSFAHVRRLTLVGLQLTSFRDNTPQFYFGHFTSLRSLSLTAPDTPEPMDLLRFICMFPSLDNLSVTGLCCHNQRASQVFLPARVPTFCGRLKFSTFRETSNFIEELARLPLHFRSMKLSYLESRCFDRWARLLASCASTLEDLEIGSVQDWGSEVEKTVPLSLETNSVLSHLAIRFEAGLHLPFNWICELLESITSPHLSRITFITTTPQYRQLRIDGWEKIERKLIQLCEQSPSLKVVFRLALCCNKEDGVAWVQHILPRLAQKRVFFIK